MEHSRLRQSRLPFGPLALNYILSFAFAVLQQSYLCAANRKYRQHAFKPNDMRYLSLLLIFGLGLTSCGEDTAAVEKAATEAAQAAQQTAYDAMMEGHDRVMPLMGNITAAEEALKQQLEAADISEDRKDLLMAAYEQLEDANDGMMDWMKNLKSLDDLRGSMDNEAIITYIKEEAADIAKVETAMNAAIGAANELVGEHSHDGDDHSGHNH